MPEELTLRIRHPQGVSTINNLTSDSTISDLKHEISTLIKSNPIELVLRVGYPPSPVDASDATNLTEAQISTGDTIIVEVHELEESKSPIRLNNSNQKKPELSDKPNVSAPQSLSQSKQNESQSISKGLSVNDNRNIDLSLNKPPTDNDLIKHMALSEEEFDVQLARALQESMSVEEPVQKASQEAENDENLFAEIDDTSRKTIELPSKDQPQKEGEASMDEDIEYARKLQEELYAENEEKFEVPRYQPPREQMDIEYEYEPVDFYDTTKQYNEENNLPEDPPLRNDDFDRPFLGRNEPFSFGQNMGINEADQNEQPQKVIQESLGRPGLGTNEPKDDYERDLQRILERSKLEK